MGGMQNCNDYSKDVLTKIFADKDKKKKYEEIYNKYKNEYPLDIKGLIKDLGINVEYKNFPDWISGRCNGKKVIELNKNHAPTRQRFTLAHELGHYLMHEGYNHRQSLVAYNFEEKVKESESNLFARSILMPADEIDNFFKEHENAIEKGGFNFVEHLINKFHVSTDALKVRLMTLGYIEGW